MRKALEELEEFESVIDDVQNFKKKIKWFKAISIEGGWEAKGEEKKVEIGTAEKEEISKLLKNDFTRPPLLIASAKFSHLIADGNDKFI